jgi:hypothetical protein
MSPAYYAQNIRCAHAVARMPASLYQANFNFATHGMPPCHVPATLNATLRPVTGHFCFDYSLLLFRYHYGGGAAQGR